MTTETTSKRPTHQVFAVIKKPGAEKGNWVPVGAAWPHKDGKGFALKLDLVPLGDAELTLREIRSEGSEQ